MRALAIIASLVVAFPVGASASTVAVGAASTGPVSDFFGVSGGMIVFEQDSIRLGLPDCSGPSSSHRWAFDAHTVIGAAMLETLQKAEALQSPVVILGAGLCPAGLDVEQVTSVSLVQ